MKAARSIKKTELMQRLLECANSGIQPDPLDLRQAERLGIDTQKIMEVFNVTTDDDQGVC